ncbi:hypothetical protein GCM10009544_43210 [Streptomyces stramineus]|uniref:Uncharacterized protein n=1 Tax=Streptomyces stramineus TaxID=173861 RepID=A0ABP3KCR3_9ACTN
MLSARFRSVRVVVVMERNTSTVWVPLARVPVKVADTGEHRLTQTDAGGHEKGPDPSKGIRAFNLCGPDGI